MKTGGTMNFLKRAGAILMLVAVFASSCNKYADDFKQLNTKLDALATQVAGVTSLVTDMAAVKAQITALQTSVAALPNTASITALQTGLTAVNGKVDGITTTLNAVAANGTATKAVVDGLKTDLAALVAKVATDNATMIAYTVADAAKMTALDSKVTGIINQLTAIGVQETNLAAAVAAVQTTANANSTVLAANSQKLIDLAAQTTALANQLTALAAADATGFTAAAATAATNAATAATANAALAVQATQILAALATASSDEAATKLVVDGLKVSLAQANATLAILLQNSNMYNGDVNITNDAEVTFFLAKIAQLGIINGDLNIDLTNVTAAQLPNVPLITKKITAVIGSAPAGDVVLNFKVGDAIDLSALVSIKGSLTVTGGAKATAADFNLSSLNNAGGTVTLNYDGSYAIPSLAKVGGDLDLVSQAVVAATTPLGTTAINFPSVAVTGKVGDVVGIATGVVTYNLATDIVLAGGVSSLTANKAINVKLGSATYATGLTIVAPLATTVDLSAATTVTAGALAITAAATANVMLDNFTTTSLLPIAVTITGPTTVVLPKYVAGLLTAPAATTVTLAKHEWAAPAVIPAVKTLTLGSLANTINLAGYPTLVSVDISGKAQTTWAATAPSIVTTAGNASLTTVKLGGNIGTASFSTCPLLTSFTTAGSVNFLTVDAMATLTAVSLGHTYFVPTNAANGGPGSDLIITNNPKLTALKSSGDYPRTITVTGNALLTSLDLSSYVTKLLAAPGAMTTITINTNKLSGTYTNAVAITPTTPYVETTITSAALSTLKALVASYPTVAPLLPGITLNVDLDAVKIGAGAATTLSAKMLLDAASTTIVNGPAPRLASIDSQAEFALVQ